MTRPAQSPGSPTGEVCSRTAEATEARSGYIQSILKDAPVRDTEYHYLDGPALLRVSGDIKPSVAAVYEEAFMAVG